MSDLTKLLPNIKHTLQTTTDKTSIQHLLEDLNQHFPLTSHLINPIDLENLPSSPIKYTLLYKLYLINSDYEKAVFYALKQSRMRNEKNFESLFSAVFYEQEICRQLLSFYKKLNSDYFQLPNYFNKEAVIDLNMFITTLMNEDVPFIGVLIEYIKKISFIDLIKMESMEAKLIINKSRKYDILVFNEIKINVGKPKFYFLSILNGLNEEHFEEFVKGLAYFMEHDELVDAGLLLEIMKLNKKAALISQLATFLMKTIKSPFNFRIAHYLSKNYIWLADLIVKELLIERKHLENLPLISILTNERTFINRLLLNANMSQTNQKIITQFCKNTLANIREIHIAISLMNSFFNVGGGEDSFIRKNIQSNITKTTELFDLTKDNEIKEFPEFILYSTMGLIHFGNENLLDIVEQLIDTSSIQAAGCLFSLGLSLIGKGVLLDQNLEEFYQIKENGGFSNEFAGLDDFTKVIINNCKIGNMFIYLLRQGLLDETEDQNLLEDGIENEKTCLLNRKSPVSSEVLVGTLKGVGCLFSNRGGNPYIQAELIADTTTLLDTTSSTDNNTLANRINHKISDNFEKKLFKLLKNYALKDLNCISSAALISIGQVYSATNNFKVLASLIKTANTNHERIFNAFLKCIMMVSLNGHDLFERIDSQYSSMITDVTDNEGAFCKIRSVDCFWYILYTSIQYHDLTINSNTSNGKMHKFIGSIIKHKLYMFKNIETLKNTLLNELYFISLRQFIQTIPTNKLDSVLISIISGTFSGTNNLHAISFLNELKTVDNNSAKIGIITGIGLITLKPENYEYNKATTTFDALKPFINDPDIILKSTAMLVIGFSHAGTANPEIVQFLYKTIQTEINPIILQSSEISIGLLLNQSGNGSLKTSNLSFSEINYSLHHNFTSINPNSYIHGTSLKFGAAISRGIMNLGNFGATLSVFKNGNLNINSLVCYLIVCDPLLQFDKWLYIAGLIKYTTFSVLVPKDTSEMKQLPESYNEFFISPSFSIGHKKSIWKIDKLNLKKKKGADAEGAVGFEVEEEGEGMINNFSISSGKEMAELGVEDEILFEKEVRL
ncbi:hypothetical protein CDIK_2606 [Cucumispora dikerogammari]|nr:hypothetical protein CDIK_2606 [Cucumispora dikerogammari]